MDKIINNSYINNLMGLFYIVMQCLFISLQFGLFHDSLSDNGESKLFIKIFKFIMFGFSVDYLIIVIIGFLK